MKRFDLVALVGLGLTLAAPNVRADDGAQTASRQKLEDTYNRAVQAYNADLLMQRTGEATDDARRAYLAGREIFGRDNLKTAGLAMQYVQLAQGADALDAATDALRIYEIRYGQSAPELVTPLSFAGGAHIKFGDLDQGRAYFKRAFALAETYYGAKSYKMGLTLLNLAMAHFDAGDFSDTPTYLSRARDILEKLDGRNAMLGLAETNSWTGQYYMAVQQTRYALPYLLNALKGFRETDAHAQELSMRKMLITAYESLGMRDAATPHCIALGAALPTPPKQQYWAIYRVRPVYPREAWLAGEEGQVIVSFTVDENGFVTHPKAVHNTGPKSLIPAAIDAAKQFRYLPRFQNGKRIKTKSVLLSFTFNQQPGLQPGPKNGAWGKEGNNDHSTRPDIHSRPED